MGPGLANALPTRPRFSWDLKSPPWTDGKGDQEKYKSNVRDWKDTHDSLPDANPNKVAVSMQGLILKSQLYGQAADLCAELTSEELKSDDGVKLIVNAVYQRDALSVISEAYDGFHTLLTTRRGPSESLKNFELRFSAAVTKFNSLSKTTKMAQCITGMLLLSNANIDQSQKVSVLAAAAPSNADFDEQSTNDDYLAGVTYKQVASVVKQCERATVGTSFGSNDNDTLSASSAGAFNRGRNSGGYKGKGRKQPSNAVLKRLPCHVCKKFGHWKDSHDQNGRLAPGSKSFDTASQFEVATAGAIMNLDSGAGPSHQKNKTVSFNMASVSTSSKSQGSKNMLAGPLVDDGAPYSAIGLAEMMLMKNIDHADAAELDPIPATLNGSTHWQYGVGQHASEPRQILGSTTFPARTNAGRVVNIRHLILDGSSQWVIGKNVTAKSNILHMDEDALQFRVEDGVMDQFTLMTHKFLSYIPRSAFVNMTDVSSAVSCVNGNAVSVRPWSETVKIVDKVHKHVCGHANFTDLRLLLERNGLWSDDVEKYVSQIVDRCTACRSTAPPQPSRKVSISSLSTMFNQVVAVDHFFLDGVKLFHCMDVPTRFSAATVVDSTSLDDAVLGFTEVWLAHFWMPQSVLGDQAFGKGAFRDMMDNCGVKFLPIPPRRHSKNPVESKHGIIRSIFLRLRVADPEERVEAAASRAVSISNDLYGNDVMSSFELAKGFTRPVVSQSVRAIPDDIVDAHNKLKAKRKLALILKSKSTKDVDVSAGDMVEVYRNTGMNKQGTWSTPKKILKIDMDSRNVTLPGKNGHVVVAAIEDIRLALPENSFASAVQRAIDDVDYVIEDATKVRDVRVGAAARESEGASAGATGLPHPSKSTMDIADGYYQSSVVDDSQADPNSVRSVSSSHHPDADFSGAGAATQDLSSPDGNDLHVGDRVQVLWPDDQLYYPGQVNTVHSNGEVDVLYDDGDVERLNMDNESWSFLNESFYTAASSVSLMELQDKEPAVLQEMMQYFGNKSFLRHQAQGFEQFPLVVAFNREEEVFVRTVKVVGRADVPPDANVIGSHVLKELLASDCTTCPPTGLRIVESIASLMGWTLSKADVKSAFLQTGPAARDVYVKPPRESHQRSTHLWLLLTAAYGLVNSNAKWQMQSDQCFFELGMLQCQQIPQLFYKHEHGKLVLLVAKVVDDIKVAGEGNRAAVFIENFNKKFKLGSVTHGPGKMRFFGINTMQHDDHTVSTDADDKLKSLVEVDISRSRRKEYDATINEIERASFASTNSSLGWIGTAASPFCSFYASYLQQKAPKTKVSHLVEQLVVLRKLKKLGSVISYPRPTDAREYELTVLVFSDASRTDDRGQLGVLTGLLVGELKNNAIFHTSTWLSFVAKRPVKNVPAAEIFAAGHGIDSGKAVAHAYGQILNMDIPVRLCVDSKDLFTSLSTQRNSIDRSIRGDVAAIRYEFQVGHVSKISWIPGKINLADVLTKKDSPLTEALQLTLFNGRLNLPFEEHAETKSAEKNYG